MTARQATTAARAVRSRRTGSWAHAAAAPRKRHKAIEGSDAKRGVGRAASWSRRRGAGLVSELVIGGRGHGDPPNRSKAALLARGAGGPVGDHRAATDVGLQHGEAGGGTGEKRRRPPSGRYLFGEAEHADPLVVGEAGLRGACGEACRRRCRRRRSRRRRAPADRALEVAERPRAAEKSHERACGSTPSACAGVAAGARHQELGPRSAAASTPRSPAAVGLRLPRSTRDA